MQILPFSADLPACGFYKICDFSQLINITQKTAKDDKHVNVLSGTIKRDENMPLSHTCNTQNKITSCMFPRFKAFVLTKYLTQNGLRRK